MATYGQGQILGAGIDPRMFVQDYSGIARIGEIQAQGYANIGKAIGQVTSEVGDYFKQQKEKVKTVDAAKQIAGLLESKAPDLVPGIKQLRATLEDQEIPLSQRISAAESLFGTMKAGYDVQNYINQNQMMQLRQQRFQQSQAEDGSGSAGEIVF